MTTFTPTLEALRARYGERFKWLVLFTLMVGAVSSVISATIVNVAIPDLSRHFVLGQERAQWVSASFMVAMTLAMLLTPWLLLRFGLRRTFIGALLLLGLGGLAGGLSPNYEVMIAMRVVEGIAAGIMQPLPNIFILRVFEEREQGKALSLFGFGEVLAPAIGLNNPRSAMIFGGLMGTNSGVMAGLAATDPKLVPYGAMTATFYTGLGCLLGPSFFYLVIRFLAI